MMKPAIRTVALPSGEAICVLGQGTWHMGERPDRRKDEIAALRLGLELGLKLIDTAEMYGNGAAEQLVREAIGGRRDEVFLVSKVLPQHASAKGTISACEHSLRRLNTDVLDLYLLHWRGAIPLSETLEGFARLIMAGKIRHWGVSNFDLMDMERLLHLEGGEAVQTDQVLYNLARRGIELDLLPWCFERQIPVMAYSPVEQGRLLAHPVLKQLAAHRGVTPAQVALAWVLRRDGVCAIPKASSPAHTRENHGALQIQLTQEELSALDRAFPRPPKPIPLEMI